MEHRSQKKTLLSDSCTFDSKAVSAKSLATYQAGPIMCAEIGFAASSLSKLVLQTCYTEDVFTMRRRDAAKNAMALTFASTESHAIGVLFAKGHC